MQKSINIRMSRTIVIVNYKCYKCAETASASAFSIIADNANTGDDSSESLVRHENSQNAESVFYVNLSRELLLLLYAKDPYLKWVDSGNALTIAYAYTHTHTHTHKAQHIKFKRCVGVRIVDIDLKRHTGSHCRRYHYHYIVNNANE